MASELLRELKDLQALLGDSESPRIGAAVAPLASAAAAATTEEDEALPPLPLPATPASPAKHARELEWQVAALRQQVAEGDARCRRFEEALQAARHDGSLAAARLQSQLAAKNDETRQLADLVFQLRSEADGLRTQLVASVAAAQAAEASTAGSLAQLQEAAAEWRQQGEEGLEAAAQERARSSAQQAEVARLRGELEAARDECDQQRRQREAAEAEAAQLRAEGSGPALVAELRSRCAQERAWRKAVRRYLEGEMHAKGELERVLLNVGTSLRVGGERTSPGAAPALPPRRVAAGQIGSCTAPPPAVTVTVTHSPVHPAPLGASGEAGGASLGSPGAAGGRRGRDPEGWRAHFQETMTAFDARHARLQAELSGLKREALQPVP